MPIVVVFTLRYIIQRSYVCANVGNVRGYRRYVDMYTSAYQRHSPTVGLHAEGLALQCLSLTLACAHAQRRVIAVSLYVCVCVSVRLSTVFLGNRGNSGHNIK